MVLEELIASECEIRRCGKNVSVSQRIDQGRYTKVVWPC